MIDPLRKALQTRWQALSAREQRGVFSVGVFLALVLGWQLLIAPAQNKLRQADTQRQAIAQQLIHMQSLQAQAQALQQRTPMSRESSLKTLQGLTPQPAIQLNPQNEQVLVTLKSVPAQVLSDWLAQARTQAQALPTEVHLTRNTSNWDGTLVLVLPRGSQSIKP